MSETSPNDPTDDGDIVDELPADLDVAVAASEYTFPNNNRRRVPATLYLVASAAALGWWVKADGGSPRVNDGVAVAALLLACWALYGFVAGRTLRIDESEALEAATREVGFAVGHASAQQIWRGWLSRPVWRILLYSSENPPERRGLALVDGIDGAVVEHFVEANPEIDEPASPWPTADAPPT